MKKLFYKLKSKRQKGFTLLEILVVLIILGVLASIAVPTYRKVIRKSRVSDGLNALDMLAGAQDKYFIQHGFYAQNITDLKAPLKEYRTGGPFSDIKTTNFTYKKIENKACIEAVSNIGGHYTLIKNYKSNDKVVCIGNELGNDCSDISDYVNEADETQYGELCPIDNPCPQGYTPNGFGGCCPPGTWPDAEGNCKTIINDPCNPSTYSPTYVWTNESCPNPDPGPDFGKLRDEGGGGGDYQQEGCGVKVIETYCGEDNYQHIIEHCYKKRCPEGLLLAESNFPEGVERCSCYKDCGPEPAQQQGGCNFQVCDPNVAQGQGGLKGGVEDQRKCGKQSTEHNKPQCNYSTGQWEWVNTVDPCIEVEVHVGEVCAVEGTPNDACGVTKLDQCLIDHDCQVFGTTKCELNEAAGNECFTGQTKPCTIPGQTGVHTCEGCHWSTNCQQGCTPNTQEECVKDDETPGCRTCDDNGVWGECGECDNCCPPDQKPDPMWFNGNHCAYKDYYCDNSDCQWKPKEEFEWYGDAECETGNVRYCNNFGKGGIGGGRGAGAGCCHLEELAQACSGVCGGCDGYTIYIPEYLINVPVGCQLSACNECLNTTCGYLHQICGGSGTGGGGGGYFPPFTPPIYPPQPGEDPLQPGVGTQTCDNCHWSECSHCDLTQKPGDEDYTCYYATYVCDKFGDEDLWFWNRYEQNKPGAECRRPGNYELCSNGNYKICQENCVWSDCTIASYNTITIQGYKLGNTTTWCSNGVKTNNLNGCYGLINCDQCCDVSYTRHSCNGNTTSLPADQCPDDIIRYCVDHPGGKCKNYVSNCTPITESGQQVCMENGEYCNTCNLPIGEPCYEDSSCLVEARIIQCNN